MYQMPSEVAPMTKKVRARASITGRLMRIWGLASTVSCALGIAHIQPRRLKQRREQHELLLQQHARQHSHVFSASGAISAGSGDAMRVPDLRTTNIWKRTSEEAL